MTTTSNHVTSPAKTGKSLSLDEYKNLTGDRQLQQMIQSAVTSALGQMYLDNPIPDHSNTEKSTMSTIDAKNETVLYLNRIREHLGARQDDPANVSSIP